MADRHSKRAGILAAVLPYINRGDWSKEGDFIVFGKESFDHFLEFDESLEPEDSAFREFADRSKVSRGKRALAQRIKLNTLPRDETDDELVQLFERIRPTADSDNLRGMLRSLGPGPSPSPEERTEDIDAALADEIVALLDTASGRLKRIDILKTRRCENSAIPKYFGEAHQCYLLGMDTACAVLCRAILEAVLIERIDPQRRLCRGSGESHIQKMIEKAHSKHLTDEQANYAEEVRLAGSSAVHDFPTFQKKYLSRMAEILANTREVYQACYSA